MSNIRVLLVDDHNLVRAGIRALLDDFEDVEVIAEASDGREAAKLARNLVPDIVLTDIAMPGLNGLEATARICKTCPGVRTIVLSMHSNEEYVVQALRAGASGYLSKQAATQELEFALRSVAGGHSYLSPTISSRVIAKLLSDDEIASAITPVLTPRQREILQLVAEGKTTREIAGILSISAKTVESHRGQLMERLGIHDVPGLVRYAIRIGLISSES